MLKGRLDGVPGGGGVGGVMYSAGSPARAGMLDGCLDSIRGGGYQGGSPVPDPRSVRRPNVIELLWGSLNGIPGVTFSQKLLWGRLNNNWAGQTRSLGPPRLAV